MQSENALLKPIDKKVGDKPSSDIISAPQACRFLSVHRNTLYKLIRNGEVPAFKMTNGGQWRFRKSELEDWLETRQRKGASLT